MIRIFTLTVLAISVLAQGPSAAQFLRSLNKIRTNPAGFIPYITLYRNAFDAKEKLAKPPGRPALQAESVAEFDETIAFLKYQATQSRLAPLTLHSRLSQVAYGHAKYLGSKGIGGEPGQGGTTAGQRMGKVTTPIWESRMSQFPPYDANFLNVINVLNSNDPSKKHRKAFFNPALKVAGFACAPHPKWNLICVLDYAAAAE